MDGNVEDRAETVLVTDSPRGSSILDRSSIEDPFSRRTVSGGTSGGVRGCTRFKQRWNRQARLSPAPPLFWILLKSWAAGSCHIAERIAERIAEKLLTDLSR